MFVTEGQREIVCHRELERERERERALSSGESLRILPRIKAWRKERDTVCLSFQNISFAGL